MSPAELRGLLEAVASGLAGVAEALPSGEAPRQPMGHPNRIGHWWVGFTMPEHPALDVSIEESGPVRFWVNQPAGLVHVRDVLRAELARIEAGMLPPLGAPMSEPQPSDTDWQPEHEDTFAELMRIWPAPLLVRDLRIELGDGGFRCDCCGRSWPAAGWPCRCPLCSGALPGQACEACKSEGGSDTRPERHTRRMLVWIDEGSGREYRREWRERPHQFGGTR